MNFKFYLTSFLIFSVLIILGFITGAKIVYDLLFPMATNSYGEEALVFIPFLVGASLLGSAVGFLVSLIVIHKLAKKWRGSLNYGTHPVLKLTALSFMSFLGILALFIYVHASLTK